MMTTVRTDTVQTPRIDAVPKVTGQAIYTEDRPLPPGTLYGAILRSPYAHARLVSIDAQQAERLPGAHTVVTREHLGHFNPFLDPPSYGTEGEGAAPIIALEKVRYEGEPVAAVAAETLALAQQALACIEAVYEDLPVLFDTREALKPEAPVIHGKRPGNLVGRFDFGWGDVEQGFRESDHIFADTYGFQSVFHHPMENLGGCIAEVRGDTLELTAPIQHPFRSRDDIAAMFGFDRNQVHIRSPTGHHLPSPQGSRRSRLSGHGADPPHAILMAVEHTGVSRCGGAPAAPPSVISSGLPVTDVPYRACEAGDQLFSPLDRQICPKIL
jgi:CO/xanthine dehydrogenase Mo-binding subunit